MIEDLESLVFSSVMSRMKHCVPLSRFGAKVRIAVAHALGAGAGAAMLVWLGPPGTDAAAHVYQRAMFLQHGFELWNNYWYSGRYSYITYSLLYYPLSAAIGIKLLAVLSGAVAAAAFALLVEGEWPTAGRWPARSFSAVSAAAVLTGAFPYALGIGLAIASLAALREGKRRLFGVLVFATLCASPLAFALLVTVLAGVAASKRLRAVVWPAIAVGVIALFGAALWRVFPTAGRFPFSGADFVAAVSFAVVGAAATWRVDGAAALRYIFVAYGVVCVAAFLVPSGLGENVARLRFVAIPVAVLVLALRGWRPLLPALAIFVLAFSWNVSPLAASFARSESDPSATALYWQPFVRYLHQVLKPGYRVEAVATAGHWEAAYLARADVPLARGWFRQDDFPQNAALYGDLNQTSYQRWLHQLGIAYVVVADAPLDYSARAEAKLVRSGHAGLQLVLRTKHGEVYRVPQPTSIITGPPGARVRALTTSSIAIDLSAAGRYKLAVRYSPYWTSGAGCLLPDNDGMTLLLAHRAGRVTIRFSLTAKRILATAVGTTLPCR